MSSTKPNNQFQLLQTAIQRNDDREIRSLLRSIDHTTLNQPNQSCLYYVILKKQWRLAKLLLEHNAVLDDPSWDVKTRKVVTNILHNAIRDENVELSFIDFLLFKTTIQIDQVDHNQDTALLILAQLGNIDLLEYLTVNHEPNVHIKDTNNCNLFHRAILSPDTCTIELLDYIHSIGVDINELDYGGYIACRTASPLTYALYNSLDISIIQKLIDLGANIVPPHDSNITTTLDPKIIGYNFVQPIMGKSNPAIFKLLFSTAMEQTPNNVPIQYILSNAVQNNNSTITRYIIDNYPSELETDVKNIQKWSLDTSNQIQLDKLCILLGITCSGNGPVYDLTQSVQYAYLLNLFE